jgi:hypothetical protein
MLAGSSQVTFQAQRARVDINLTGSQVWRFGAAQPDGTRDVLSLPGDSHFNCLGADVSGAYQIAVCVRMDSATQAHGALDCAGGQSDDGYDVVASVDHNTNYNNLGFAQDPECDDVYRNPNNDPDGELVTSWIEDGTASHVHLGTCNSAAHVDRSGAFPAGGLRLTETLVLRPFLNKTCTTSLCPSDGAPFDAAAGDVRVTADMTSGGAKGVIFDFLNNNEQQTLGTTGSGNGPSICGIGGNDACVTSIAGTPYPALCPDVAAGTLHSGRLVSAITALDLPSPIYDVVATIGITCQ